VTRQRGFAAVALDAALLTPASADPHHGGLVFGLTALGAAAVVGAVTIVTAAVRVSAPFYAPGPASYPPAPLMVAEARHFPALAAIVVREGGRAEVVGQIALMFEREAARRRSCDRPTGFDADQFLQLVVSLPQRRALGLGTPLTEAEFDAWADDCVHLFLNGCRF
jgi:AefR-like transcriptional repressor, C-terminal domain